MQQEGASHIAQAVASAEILEGDAENRERDLRLSRFARNDYGNGQRLLARFGQNMMYVRASGWHWWDGMRWCRDEEGSRAHLLAHRTAVAIAHELHAVQDEGPVAFGGSETAYKDFLRQHRKWMIASGNAQRIRSMLSEAQPYITHEMAELNRDPYLFNVENGTLDLRDGVALREHRRRDFITRVAPVRYEPGVSDSTFRAFLNRIMPEGLDQKFLQVYLGYSLTGKMTEEKMLLCHGSGGNGKSTLMQAVMNVFGEGQYAMTLQFESLQLNERRGANDATPDIARLPGMRFVVAAEPESGVKLSTSAIKKMTSIESINARHLNQGFFTFKPEFKLMLSFNDKPVVPAQDEGTWRRLMMLEFNQHIPPEERDGDIDGKLSEEKAGILNWMLDGYRIWMEEGLEPPPSVIASTIEYRDENDNVGCFIRQNITPKPGFSLTAKELYQAYAAWCENNGIRPWSQKKLGARMTQMGFKRGQSGTISYLDVDLVAEAKVNTDSQTNQRWDMLDD